MKFSPKIDKKLGGGGGGWGQLIYLQDLAAEKPGNSLSFEVRTRRR